MIPRYSRPEMVSIWSAESRFAIWFEIEAHALIGNRPIDLEVDGGITADNARAVADAGCNVFVAGSSIYGGNDPATYQPRISAIRTAASTRLA